jgi:signal transduction histidine kinase
MSAGWKNGRQCVAVLSLDEALRIRSIQFEADPALEFEDEMSRGERLDTALKQLNSAQRQELESKTASGKCWTGQVFISSHSMGVSILPARDEANGVVGFFGFFFPAETASERARWLDRWQKAVVAAADHERQSIARLLHDGLWPHILGAAFLSRSLVQQTGKNPQLGEGLEKLNELIHSAVQQSKKILSVDAGTELPLSLRTAILEFSSQFNGGRECEFLDDPSFPECPADVAANGFRLIEDVVLQAYFDYHATRVVIRLEHGDAPPRVVIAHNGILGEVAPVPSTLMNCRVAACGGAIGFHVSPSTCIAMILLPPA